MNLLSIKEEDLVPHGNYYVVDRNLNNFNKVSISMNSHSGIVDSGISPLDVVRSSFLDQIHNYINGKIRSFLLESEIVDYLNLSNVRHCGKFTIESISIYSPKYIIIPVGIVASDIEDFIVTNTNYSRITRYNTTPTPFDIGCVFGSCYYVDPYLNMDGDFYLFDCIRINIANLTFNEGWDSYHFVDKCSFNLAFSIENPRCIGVVTSKSSKHWDKWVSLNRDSKINKIIE